MITDELREWAHGFNGPWKRHEEMLLAIADRIDAAYQKAEEEWQAKDGQSWFHGYYECHAELMEGNEVIADDLKEAGYIELPKDADGQIIHVGDMLDGYGRTIRVKELRNAGTWHLVDELGNEWHDHEAFVHVQPDSWERIIRDAQGDGILNQIDGRPSDFEALVERCKRLAGEDE